MLSTQQLPYDPRSLPRLGAALVGARDARASRPDGFSDDSVMMQAYNDAVAGPEGRHVSRYGSVTCDWIVTRAVAEFRMWGHLLQTEGGDGIEAFIQVRRSPAQQHIHVMPGDGRAQDCPTYDLIHDRTAEAAALFEAPVSAQEIEAIFGLGSLRVLQFVDEAASRLACLYDRAARRDGLLHRQLIEIARLSELAVPRAEEIRSGLSVMPSGQDDVFAGRVPELYLALVGAVGGGLFRQFTGGVYDDTPAQGYAWDALSRLAGRVAFTEWPEQCGKEDCAHDFPDRARPFCMRPWGFDPMRQEDAFLWHALMLAGSDQPSDLIPLPEGFEGGESPGDRRGSRRRATTRRIAFLLDQVR